MGWPSNPSGNSCHWHPIFGRIEHIENVGKTEGLWGSQRLVGGSQKRAYSRVNSPVFLTVQWVLLGCLMVGSKLKPLYKQVGYIPQIGEINQLRWFVSPHLKNMLVKLDHFPKVRMNIKKIFELPQPSNLRSRSLRSRTQPDTESRVPWGCYLQLLSENCFLAILGVVGKNSTIFPKWWFDLFNYKWWFIMVGRKKSP